ncbi:hypothetical protein HDE_13627 [Halotydeus destructor]|nr:hypothetical protein HDE_13627 [Halotydeus destructor]
MLPSILLGLIVLTTVSSEYYSIKMVAVIKDRHFASFGSTARDTFSEAQRVCSLYGGHVAEPEMAVIRKLRGMFGSTFWVNGYYDTETSTWRWISDHLPIDGIDDNWDTDQPGCQGEDCATWRPFIANAANSKFSAIDERNGTKLPFICEMPRD